MIWPSWERAFRGLIRALTVDLLDGSVKWTAGDVRDLKGQTVSRRFTLKKARFYSCWLE